MIFDGSTETEITVPGQGFFFALSDSIDLNPNYGSGVNARRAPIFSDGARIYAHFIVTEAFASSTTALANFHLLVAQTGDLATAAVNIGSVTGIIQVAQTELWAGMLAAALPLNAQFTIVGSPYSESFLPTFDPLTMRYVGAAITVPNYNATAQPFFTAGKVKVKIGIDIGSDHSDTKFRTYPAGFAVT